MKNTNKITKIRLAAAVAAAVPALVAPMAASAQVIWSDDFNNAATAANYNVYSSPISGGGPNSDATFAWDYSTLGVPIAPHTTDSTTLGLRLRVGSLGNTTLSVGAIDVATIGLVLPSQYSISFDLWGNYLGSTGSGLASSGSNGTLSPGVGLLSSGSALQSPNGNDGLIFDVFHDGGVSGTDYRIYTNNARLAATANYAGGSTDNANAYYNFLASQAAPSIQTNSNPSTQFGSSPVGVVGFQWTSWTIVNDGVTTTWSINGHLIGTVTNSTFNIGGSQVALGSFDSNASGNTATNALALNFDVFDNFVVTAIPEPSLGALFAVGAGAFGALGLVLRRRK